jgi:hypothetical protein
LLGKKFAALESESWSGRIPRKNSIMKNRSLVIAGLLLALFSTGCGEWKRIRGNGHIATDSRPVSAFTRVVADGFFQLEWRPGAPSFSLTTDENLFSHIRTTNEGEVLRIKLEESIAPTKGVKIAISSPALTGADLSGALELDASQLSGEKFALETSGAGKVTLAGKINRLIANLTGATKLRASDLAAEDVEISITGAGKADVFATNLLRAAITGAGKVSYSGHPKSVQKQIAGAGSISPND